MYYSRLYRNAVRLRLGEKPTGRQSIRLLQISVDLALSPSPGKREISRGTYESRLMFCAAADWTTNDAVVKSTDQASTMRRNRGSRSSRRRQHLVERRRLCSPLTRPGASTDTRRICAPLSLSLSLSSARSAPLLISFPEPRRAATATAARLDSTRLAWR